jgi:hypothetical protein
MGKRFIISESEKNDIRKMHGILNEQSGGDLVPQSVYDAIEKIESKYSYMNNGEIKGASYKGNQIETDLSNYIENTIGLDNWFKINEKLRGQIYAYAFQADSGEKGMTFRWIAGLANAIDKRINRMSIVNKSLNDTNVQNAINIIKNACKNRSINSYYNNYLSILDQQYKSADYNNNYKYIWKYRPTAIERFMNGENEIDIFDDWNNSFNQTDESIKIVGDGFNDLRSKLKSETSGVMIDENSVKIDIDTYTVTYNTGNKKIQNMSLIIDDQGQLENRLTNIRKQNPTMVEKKEWKGKVGNIEWIFVIIY